MTNEQAIEILANARYADDLQGNDDLTTAHYMAIKALEQQPCEDCISRQAVLDMATTIQTDDFSGNEIIEVVDVDDIKALPSVTPTRPIGHWIAGVDRWGDIVTTVNGYRCSECCDFNADKDNFCPNCGAKMAESEGNA